MNVYIDLPNLRSYAKQGGHQSFKACTDMLRQHFNLCFTFKKESIQREKKQSMASIMNLMKMLTANRGNSESFQWDTLFPERPLKEDVYDTMSKEQLMSVYLLDDPNIKTLVSHGCLLFAGEGEEIKALSHLLIEDRVIPSKPFPVKEMTDWSVIANNASPCTDIIIVDPYLFAQSEFLYEKNAYKVIEHLAHFNSQQSLNVVIFTFNEYPDMIDGKKGRRPILFSSISRSIKAKLKEISNVEHNVTFVVMPETKVKEHDRYIITNYKMFNPGNSFTFFDDKGRNVSTGRFFNVYTHGDKDMRELSLSTISDLQHLVDEVKGGLNTIIGDKKSRFLTFD